MKNSGIEWIGEIPENWEVVKLKNIFKIISGCGFSDKLQGEKQGNYPFCKSSDINGEEKYIDSANNYVNLDIVVKEKFNIIPAYSILMSKIGEAMKKNHRKINIVPCIVDNNCQGLVNKNNNNINFLYYLMTNINMEWFDNGGTIPCVNNEKLKNFSLPYPPIDEQQKIADYLDKRCENIEGLVELQNRMIEKLKEYKQSVITEAVTKGLNPAAKMKNSGVEWIGEIPENWEVKRLKNCGEFCSNGVDKKIYPDLPTYKAIHYINVYKNKLGILNDDSNYLIISCTNEKADLTRLQKGDIIITNSSETPDDIGVAAYVNDIDKNTLLGYHLMRFRPISNINSKFMLYCLNSKYVNVYFASVSNGITRYSLLGDDIKSLCFSCPPIDEQKKIADYLDAKCAEIDRLIEIKQKKIEKLQDYKKSLIYECVTGKREVS